MVEHRFDLRRVDIETGRLDHAFQARRKIEKAVAVHAPDVTGVQPGAAIRVQPQRIACRLGFIEVAQHDGGAGDADFAFLVRREFFRRIDLANAGQHVWQRQADRAFAILVQRRGHDTADGFGQSVAFEQLHVCAARVDHFFEALFHWARQGVGTGENGFQARQVGALQRLVARERIEQGRHADEQIGALLADEFGDNFRREGRHQDRFRAGHEGRIHAHAETEAVKDRQDGENGIAFAHAAPRGHTHALGDEIAMRQQDAFGRAGGAAGKKYRGGIKGAGLATGDDRMTRAHHFCPPANARVGWYLRDMPPLGEPESESFQWRQRIGNAREQDGDKRKNRLDCREHRVERIEGQRNARFADVQVVLDFRRGGERMNQRRQRAQFVGGVKRDDALRGSRHRDQQPVTCV